MTKEEIKKVKKVIGKPGKLRHRLNTIYAGFDENGKSVWDEKEMDLKFGLLVRIEEELSYEKYHHWVYFVDKDCVPNKIAEFENIENYEVFPIIGESKGKAKMWHYLACKTNPVDGRIKRRYWKNLTANNNYVFPFFKKYDSRETGEYNDMGFPSESLEDENGLIVYNRETKVTLTINKGNELAGKSFSSVNKGFVNIKKDKLFLGQQQLLETAGWIDIVKLNINFAYIVKSEVIDFFHGETGGFEALQYANPTVVEDSFLKKIYESPDRHAGPQMKHTVYRFHFLTQKLERVGSLTDTSRNGYEFCFQPTEEGIVAISRASKKKVFF